MRLLRKESCEAVHILPRRRLLASALVMCGAGLIALPARVLADERVSTAVMFEQNFAEDDSTEEMFYVAAIDGLPVKSARKALPRASDVSTGLAPVTSELRLHLRPQRLTLVAKHLHALPSEAAPNKREYTDWQVQGEVVFDPARGGEYFVAGELKKDGSSVWVADWKTGQRVSSVVTNATGDGAPTAGGK